MIPMIDGWVVPGLLFLAEWSVRWGLVLALLSVWFVVRPLRRTSIRYLLCLSALAAGVLIPVAPRWGHAPFQWPSIGLKPASVPPTVEPRPSIPETFPSRAPVGQTPRPPAQRLMTHLRPSKPSPGPVRAEFPKSWRIASLAAAGAWASIVLAMLARLVCGWWTLNRLRRGAVEADSTADALLLECRTRLGLSRRVKLAAHPAVASPVVAGGLHPIVLVPTDWPDWPETHRRASLLHELAHLVRYDDWAKLAQEPLRAGFFFHPLVLWLLNRLDREREHLCDEAAVSMGGSDPLTYARLLLDLARRPGRLVPVTSLSRPGWLPFLDRRTVEVRIDRLLEEDMLTTISRPSPSRSILLTLFAVAVALGIGGLRVNTVVSAQAPEANQATPSPRNPVEEPEAPKELRGVVLDPDNRPVSGATLVAGCSDPGQSGHEVLTTDADGRFAWSLPEGAQSICLVAHKPGLSAIVLSAPARSLVNPLDLKLRLLRPEPFNAVLVDQDGHPVPSAQIRVHVSARASESKEGSHTMTSVCYDRIPWNVVDGSKVAALFSTTTGADGSFTFSAFPPHSGLLLEAVGPDGRLLRTRARPGAVGQARQMMEQQGFATDPAGETTRLVAVPAARVEGQVVSTLPDLDVSGLRVSYQQSQPYNESRAMNFGASVLTDARGRFVLDGLTEGTVNVFVHGPGENETWTYRAARDVPLIPGKTSEVKLELVRGVEIEGTVLDQGTNRPVKGAQVGVYGPARPRTGAMTTSATTDALGRYRYRLPHGETYFYVMGAPAGFMSSPKQGSSVTVTIPDGAPSFKVPPITVVAAITVRGRVVDSTGSPIAGVQVVGLCEGGVCQTFGDSETLTDRQGEFRLPPTWNNMVVLGQPALLRLRLPGGPEQDVTAIPADDGSVLVRLPVAPKIPEGVNPPEKVAPDELAGVVVDTDGHPIENAEVDAWTWYPGNETKTDARGFFRIGKLDANRKVEVRVRKPGYTPQLFLTQPTGEPGWVVVLGNKTYFEGQVTDPEGKPVADALIRANNGPKRADGVTITSIWTETTTGDDGQYRLYAQADVYDVQVRVPGVGVARLTGTALEPDQARRLDIHLKPGVTFHANLVDSLSGEPVPGVRLWHWRHPGVEGRSDDKGVVKIDDMLPGNFRFQVEAPSYARWWSEQASSEWSRLQTDPNRGTWQRNFDGVDFDLSPNMDPVTITLERGVTVTGRVLDPDGNPVAGATVAPALTGTGNSLTGDTRFSATTAENGEFQVLLPASGKREYNLVAHDGAYKQWRTWANGVLPPIHTRPGETIRAVEIRLTRPSTVRGRVLDAQGHPIPGHEVRASASDRMENRYYDPSTRTNPDGTYELKFIRPGEQYVQVAPFWLDARQAPEGTSRTLTLPEGESKDGVDFTLP